MSARPLYILGTGGLAREVAQLARQIDPTGSRWITRGYIAATEDEVGADIGAHMVVGDDGWLLRADIEADVVIGIGHPELRAEVARAYAHCPAGLHFPNLVHPTAVLDPDEVTMGQGNLIAAGCVMTVAIEMGDFNVFNWNVTVGHGARLGSYNVVNPAAGVAGEVVIGDEVLVGAGARVLENLEVGSGARIGAGAVVTSGVQAGSTVVGVPARQLIRRPTS